MKTKRRELKQMTGYQVCILGVLTAAAISLVCTAVLAVFIQNEYLEITAAKQVAVFMQFLSSLLGALVAGKLAVQNKMIITGVVAAGYLVFLTGCAILLYDGITGRFFGGLAACGVGWGAAVFLCLRGKKPTGSKKRRVAAR